MIAHLRPLPDNSRLHAAAVAAATTIGDLLAPIVPENDRVDGPGHGPGGYYEWYYAYGLVLRPTTLLEVGVLGGGSVISTALGARDAGCAMTTVWLVDDGSDARSVPLSVVSNRLRSILPPSCIVRPIEEDSQRMRSLPPSAPFDIISIDADHRVGPCYHDLRISLPMLAHDGHVLVDDAQWSWVRDAVDAFVADRPHLDDLYVETMTGTRILHFAGEHLDHCPLLNTQPEGGI